MIQLNYTILLKKLLGQSMKLIKFSLAAIMALGTCSYAADSVAEALKNGKASGALQAAYWSRNKGTDAEIINFGLDVSYETATFYNFGAKATFQTSSSPFINDDAREVFKDDMYGSGSQLSELYLSYALGKTTAQVGRMYFGTPLVAGSGSRMNRESFEGAIVTNSDIQDTKITIGYVQKMQNRTDGEGDIGRFTKDFTWQGEVAHGAYTAVVENSSIENVNLTVAYLDAKDLMEVAYLEAVYKKDNFALASQYYYSEKEGVDSTDLFGLKGNISFGKASFVAAYTTTGDEYVYAGLGNGADFAYTGSPILSDTYNANSDAYKVGASYAVIPALNVGVNYVFDDRKDEEISYASATADYTFSGAVDGLNVAVLYEEAGKDSDDNEFRLNVTYPF